MNYKNDEHDLSNNSYEKLESFIGDEINNMVIIQAHHQRKSPTGKWNNYKKHRFLSIIVYIILYHLTFLFEISLYVIFIKRKYFIYY